MKAGFTVHQHFDASNHTKVQSPTIDDARETINNWMRTQPDATYSVYRNSTSALVLQFEGGKETINRMR